MNERPVKDAILIAGPTASGKSALAIRLAQKTGGYIINADSMQVYDVLDRLSARPSSSELREAEHYLYGHVAPSIAYSTGKWLQDVTAILQRPDLQQRRPIFVGGTGLYFRALLGGLSQMPMVPDAIRLYWRGRHEAEGAPALHVELTECDPACAATLLPSDGQRIVRALEIWQATGKSLLDWQKGDGQPAVDGGSAHKLVLLPDRSWLRARIAQRFEQMWDHGAIDEVQALTELALDASLPAMKAIGVREVAAFLAGDMTRAQAIERAVIATRQYSKRQSTWFRNQLDASWQFFASGDAAFDALSRQ